MTSQSWNPSWSLIGCSFTCTVVLWPGLSLRVQRSLLCLLKWIPALPAPTWKLPLSGNPPLQARDRRPPLQPDPRPWQHKGVRTETNSSCDLQSLMTSVVRTHFSIAFTKMDQMKWSMKRSKRNLEFIKPEKVQAGTSTSGSLEPLEKQSGEPSDHKNEGWHCLFYDDTHDQRNTLIIFRLYSGPPEASSPVVNVFDVFVAVLL